MPPGLETDIPAAIVLVALTALAEQLSVVIPQVKEGGREPETPADRPPD